MWLLFAGMDHIRKKEKPELKPEGSYENIEYIYASGSCFRNDIFLSRRLI